MRVWKVRQYYNYMDEELGDLLNNLQKDGASIKEILPVSYTASGRCGSYKIIYTLEDIADE